MDKDMNKRLLLLALAGVVLCSGTVLMGATHSWGDDGFYVISVGSMYFKGNWDVSKTYNARDVVFYDGSSWFSLAGNNRGNVPGDAGTSPQKWTLAGPEGG